jgi:hypothetical protein
MSQPTRCPRPRVQTARLTWLAAGVVLGCWASVASAQPAKLLSRNTLPATHIDWALATTDEATPAAARTAPTDEVPATGPIDKETSAELDARTDKLPPMADAATRATVDTSASPLQRLGTSLRGLWASVQSRVRLSVYQPAGSQTAMLSAELGRDAAMPLRGLQMLPGYAAEGGFRATAGLLRSERNNWWTTHTERYGSMSTSYQRLNASGVLSSTNLVNSDANARNVHPYVGAGYSTPLGFKGSPTLWRFNADLGLLSIDNDNLGRLTPAQQDRGMDDVLRELRIRPNVKVSVGYAF